MAWVVVAVLMGLVIVKNQILDPRAHPTLPQPVGAEAAAKAIDPPDLSDPFTMQARLMAALNNALEPDAPSRKALTDAVKPTTDVERVRAAIVRADIAGKQEGLETLRPLDVAIMDDAALAQDVAVLKAAYAADGRVADPADQQRLVEHHGWFGQLAGVYGQPTGDAGRQALFAFAGRLLIALGAVAVVLCIAVVGGLTASIIMLTRLWKGRERMTFAPPAPGGSVYLETLACFLAGYLLLGFAVEQAAAHLSIPRWTLLAAHWLLAVVPLYPVIVRGVPFAQWRREVGLHAERGLLREVGAGIFAYFAALPLVAGAMAVTAVMVILRAFIERSLGRPHEPLSNPIKEMIEHGSTPVLITLYVLATLWAPLVEELIFRGSLLRHLRRRLGVLAAAMVSALFFGFMHSYEALLLLPVIMLGFVFALMRQWRGSLVPSMTAHALHNGVMLALALLVLSALKD